MYVFKKYNLVVVAVLIVSMGACSLLTKNSESDDRITINTDSQDLNKRVEIVNEPIDLTNGKIPSEKTAMTYDDQFVLVANVESPFDNNNNRLSATSIDICSHWVYVSYHLNGSPYAGAIDIIDVRDHDKPQIVSTLTFADTDVNGLEIEENRKKLWFVGGRDVEQSGYSDEGHNGAIVGEIDIDHDKFDAGEYRETPLPSYSGNAVVEHNNQLYVVSGATGGGFYEIDKSDLKIKDGSDINYAKYVDRRHDDVIGLSLGGDQSAKFEILDFKKDDRDTFDIGLSVSPMNGKNVIEQSGSITFAALGDQGVKGYKFDGNQDPLVYEFKPAGSDVANGVTVDWNHVFIAHGTDGLYITNHAMNGHKDPALVANWNSGSGSANFVKTDGQYIIVANGKDGLNILRKEKK